MHLIRPKLSIIYSGLVIAGDSLTDSFTLLRALSLDNIFHFDFIHPRMLLLFCSFLMFTAYFTEVLIFNIFAQVLTASDTECFFVVLHLSLELLLERTFFNSNFQDHQ